MQHVHYDIIQEWIKDTSRTIQWCPNGGNWTDVQGDPQWSPWLKFRFKPEPPKYIVYNSVNVPEPVRGKLEDGQEYWLANVSNGRPSSYRWDSTFTDKHWLRLGLIHLTKEAAQAHIDAMLLPSRIDK